MSKKKIVVFASGGGSNFQSIIDAVHADEINAEITGFITNNASAYSIERAKKAGISALVIAEKYFSNLDEFEASLLKHLELFEAELIVLAGYMRKIPASIIYKYEGHILNIHPALLPKFGGKGMYGMHVHRAVIDAREKESGCTVHLVTQEYDEGPILAQATVPVFEDDTAEELQKRILKEEHRIYPEVLKKLCLSPSTN